MIAAPIAGRGLFSSLFFVAAVRNPVVFIKKMELEVKYVSATFKEQIAPADVKVTPGNADIRFDEKRRGDHRALKHTA
jgi:hypothetical protein